MKRIKKKLVKKCPSCGRAVQKLEGCDAMKCGQDYHGGNVQNGCGVRFNWKSAPPYVSLVANGPTQEKIIIKPPVINNYTYPEYIKCDGCKQIVVGLLFSCVNCECYYLCEKCEFKEQPSHNKNHFFKILERY